MLVTICVPVYGVEKYIERCAKSLFEQTYNEIEYLFINDCTNDKSIDLLLSVLKQYPQRQSAVHIINHAINKGLAAARNTAVENATGEFLIHVDSDDYLMKDAVELLVRKQRENDYDIVFGSAIRHYENYSEIVSYPLGLSSKDMLIGMLQSEIPQYIWGKLIRRSIYTQNNISATEGINNGEDVQVIPQLVINSSHIAVIKDVVYYYDCTNMQSYSSQFDEKKDKERRKALDNRNKALLEKDNSLEDAINIGSIRNLVRNKMAAARIGNYSYFNELCLLQLGIEKDYWKCVSILFHIPLYSNNIILIKYYVIIMGHIKHTTQSICEKFFKRRGSRESIEC